MVNLSQTLQEIETEDFIWIIYSFIVLGAIISNAFERDWILNHNVKARNISKMINITIFFVTFIIYFYFVVLTYKRLKEVRNYHSVREIFLNEANFVAASLFLIGGLIYLFTEISSQKEISDPQQII